MEELLALGEIGRGVESENLSNQGRYFEVGYWWLDLWTW
jgi:hypothetical protein